MIVQYVGKTLKGKQYSRWYVGLRSNINGRGCEILRFHRRKKYRVLVKWLEPFCKFDSRMLPGSVNINKTQWVDIYQIQSEIYNENH